MVLRDLDYEKIHDDWNFLVQQCFVEVLEEIGEGEVAQSIKAAKEDRQMPDFDCPELIAQAFTIVFELLNLVEENAGVQQRRHLEVKNKLTQVAGLWGQDLHHLKELGLTGEEIVAALPKIRIEPVLTAHPTEAKRATVLEHHRRLYLLLVKRENQMWTPHEQTLIRDEIKAELERLWRTGDVFLEKPDIGSERRNILYYLRWVFPDVLAVVDDRLRQSWQEAGFDSTLLRKPGSLPRLSFGNWVGGDRDGHPLVTAQVTQQTLRELRANALGLLHERLTELACRLSLSEALHPAPENLLARIEELVKNLGETTGQRALRRNPQEPWRQFVNLMLTKLPVEISAAAQPHLRDTTVTYRRASELLQDLTLLYQALVATGANRLASSDVEPLLRQVEVFGFHLAALDIRQNSRFHDLAIAQLLIAARLGDSDFPQWDETRRLAFLNQELKFPRPFAHSNAVLGTEADAVLACYRVIGNHLNAYGREGLGVLIVSMTHSLSDLLAVYLLAREAGLVFDTAQGLICPLPVVPLFETIEDLQHSQPILQAFLEHPLTRRSLEYQRCQTGAEQLIQQVMVGYSDSNKDGGICASLWNLYQAQAILAKVGQQQGVRIRFFHGRGGTISRGAGPTDRFLKALPPGALNGELRMTEQGESIAQKYANRLNGAYNLELLLAGTVTNTLRDWYRPRPTHSLEPVIDRLAASSRQCYQALLHSEGFVSFFRQATPVDIIESSFIGSRPSRRSGQQTLADLRAIPWVFSWGQVRCYLSGWYGVGSALKELSNQDAQAFRALQEQFLSWPPAHYMFSNVATSIATADMDIMAEYADLVQDSLLRERIVSLIREEYKRTKEFLERLYGGPLAERRPDTHKTVSLRQRGLWVLHHQQIALLRQWRHPKQTEEKSATEKLLLQLLLTVNAIASGLGATG